MTMKSDKGKKTIGSDHKPSSGNADKKPSSKPKKQEEEDDDDEWEKPEEEEEWDPDFDEFDIPTSKNKKSTGTVAGGKKGKEEEDDFKVDEEFKDLYDDKYDDDDEDY